MGGSWLKSTGLFFVSGIITILCSSFSDEFQAKRESGYLVADTDKSMIICPGSGKRQMVQNWTRNSRLVSVFQVYNPISLSHFLS
jgi:hypothetical protein